MMEIQLATTTITTQPANQIKHMEKMLFYRTCNKCYQLSMAGNTGSGFANVAVVSTQNVTTTTLNITKPTSAMTGYIYRCVVSNDNICGTVTRQL
jgi:hypothetical protein